MSPQGQQGATGAIGPQGPAGVVSSAYGGLFNNAVQTITTTDTTTTVEFANQMPNLDVTYGTNSITVANAGTYKVDYTLAGTSGTNTSTTVAVQNNGANVAGTTSTRQIGDNPVVFTNSSIVNLSAGDVLTLGITSTVPATITTQPTTTLTVFRLS